MKRFNNWINWSLYRFQITKHLHKKLCGTWSWFECWSYSSCFHYGWEKMIEEGDKPDPEEDVQEDLDCWRC